MEFELLTNEKLSQYTTLKIGGVADYLAVVKSVEELKAALQFANANTATPPLILGGGSNVLCNDDGYRGLVIINKILGYEVQAESDDVVTLQVGSGEVFDEVIKRTIKDGYWGLENLSAIPGSVGATPIQNVGAYGVEIANAIEEVSATNIETDESKNFTPEECQFSYRDSFFKTSAGKKWCVTHVSYKLSKKPNPNLSYQDLQPLQEKGDLQQIDIREHVVMVRGGKFPDWQTVGTAGSFFKNPIINQDLFNMLVSKYPDLPSYSVNDELVKVPLGWVLDKICNLKGYQNGPVRLYEKQALVLVAEIGATATQVEEFASFIIDTVREKTSIEIEREVLSV
jgi:UDP-N-acetylmuramate dehydrogenase